MTGFAETLRRGKMNKRIAKGKRREGRFFLLIMKFNAYLRQIKEIWKRRERKEMISPISASSNYHCVEINGKVKGQVYDFAFDQTALSFVET